MNKRMTVGVLALMAAAAPIRADEQSDWLKARQAEYATWQAAHPDVEAQIADLKAKTAALVAAYVPPSVPAKYADVRAQSAALTQAQRAQAQQLFATAFTLWQSGDFAAAKIGFSQGLAIDPANGMANYYMGDLEGRDGNWQAAALYMDRSSTLAPGTPEALKASAWLQTIRENVLKDAYGYVGERYHNALRTVYQDAIADPRLKQPTQLWHVEGSANEIWDAPETPRMSIVAAGEYTLGTVTPEPKFDERRQDDELRTHNPMLRARITSPFALSRADVTVSEFSQFVQDAHYGPNKDGCTALVRGQSTSVARLDWKNPGYRTTGQEPVVCIKRQDAIAYVNWLSQKTKAHYRLASRTELDFADQTQHFSPSYVSPAVGLGVDSRLADIASDCRDGENLVGVPTDGSPRSPDGCTRNDDAVQWLGFRVARTL